MSTVNVRADRCRTCKATLAEIRRVARIAIDREARSLPIERQLAEIKRKREFMATCSRCPQPAVRA